MAGCASTDFVCVPKVIRKKDSVVAHDEVKLWYGTGDETKRLGLPGEERAIGT